MITYVIIVSERFPKRHPKAGKGTGFVRSIEMGTKLHTIRGNYKLWKKRIEKVENGEAIISLRTWTGKPYASKQKEFMKLDNSMHVGIEAALYLGCGCWSVGRMNNGVDPYKLAENDGLSISDFSAWHRKAKEYVPMALIHFTDFRYLKP